MKIFLRQRASLLCTPKANKTSQTLKTNQAAAMGEGPTKSALPLLLLLLCAISLQQAAAAGQDPWQVGSKALG